MYSALYSEMAKIDVEKAIALYESGMTHKEVGYEFGVNFRVIQKLFKKVGYKSRKRGGRKYFGNENGYWKGGRTVRSEYIRVSCKEHPRASKRNGYVPEHILVMESHLGRYVNHYGKNNPDNEVVHHINHDKHDNRIENLQLMTAREHSLLHKKERLASVAKPVRRLDTGEVYPSATSGSLAVGRTANVVRMAIKRNGKAGGTKWEYV